MALRFFSRLPTGTGRHERPNLGRIAPVLPLASLVIGLGPALLLVGACWLGLPAYFAVTLAMVACVTITGAMAEDALADSVDGLFGGHTVERRLEIMKDSRHGTYGVTALCLLLLLRIFAIGSLAAVQPLAAAAVWLGGTVLARSAALFIAARLPPVRREGVSATVGQLPWRNFGTGLMLALVLGLMLAAQFASLRGLTLALVFGSLTIAGWTPLCHRKVGGQTGDLIGGLMALTEIAVLTGLLAGF